MNNKTPILAAFLLTASPAAAHTPEEILSFTPQQTQDTFDRHCTNGGKSVVFLGRGLVDKVKNVAFAYCTDRKLVVTPCSKALEARTLLQKLKDQAWSKGDDLGFREREAQQIEFERATNGYCPRAIALQQDDNAENYTPS